MIEKHFLNMSNDIKFLIKSNRINPYVHVIMITESFFRNKPRMIGEVIFWYWCTLFFPRRVASISIGICQMQIRHWISLGFFKGDKPTIAKIIMLFDVISNYDVCFSYLNSNDILESESLITIGTYYRGRIGNYYYNTLQYCFTQLTSLENITTSNTIS
ncbi:MAG TPA: hypothetical protein VFD03_10645 [Clostridia bacterium]|nr:hypothetical protein [Clostridia bacterium]